MRKFISFSSGGARTAISMVATMIVLTLISSACRHREFLYEQPSKRIPVIVEFDWSLDPGASPEEMTVYFFRISPTQSKNIAYDFKGRDGGEITLSPGVYAAICHNNDSDRHGFVGYDSFDEFGIRLNDNRNAGNLNSSTSSFLRSENERISHSPDSMWVASVATFVIDAPNPSDVSTRAPKVIRFKMQPVVSHYTFFVHNPLNFNNSISVSATLSGMASTVHPGRNATGDETVTHLFNMVPTRDGGLFGEFLTFGHCGGKPLGTRAGEDDSTVPHILVIHATMADGKRWSSVHDVSDQIHSSDVQDCVIRLDSLAFPQGSGSGGGWSPSVGGWIGGQEHVGM